MRQRRELIKGIEKAIPFVPKNPFRPILSHLRMYIKDSQLQIEATNMEIGISIPTQIQLKENIDCLIKPSQFLLLLHKMRGTKIYIKEEEGSLLLFNNTIKYTIPLDYSPKDYPSFVSPPSFSIIISGKTWNEMVKKVSFAMGIENKIYSLKGAHFQIIDNQIELTATDGKRCAHIKRNIPLIINTGLFQQKIQTKSFGEFGEGLMILSDFFLSTKSLMKTSDTIKITKDKNHIFFGFNDIIVFVRVFEENNFPNWKILVPTKNEITTIISVGRDDLKKAIEQVSCFCDRELFAVKFQIIGNKKIILQVDNLNGKVETQLSPSIKTTGNGEQVDSISFNYKYILSFLSTTDSPKISIELINSTKVSIWKGENDKECLYLLMPITKEK